MLRGSVQVSVDTLSPALRRTASALSPARRAGLMKVMGKRLEVDLQVHFLEKNAQPNKKGWPKQNFWNQVRNATALTYADSDEARVTIAHPAIRAKVFGATITPKEQRSLAIPLTSEAYGQSPRNIDKLFVLKTNGKAFLARELGERLEFLYILLKRVRVPADPTALPPDADLSRALERTGRRYLTRQLRKNA